MSGNASTTSPSNPNGGPPVTRATVAQMYRSDEAVRLLLAEISAEPRPEKTRRRQVIDILDDLAEEMIGRRRRGDPALQVQIRRMRADLDRTRPDR